MGTGRGQRWTFKEARADGGVTLILGGRVLVVDIESAVDREDETHPKPFVIRSQDLICLIRQRCDDGGLGFCGRA